SSASPAGTTRRHGPPPPPPRPWRPPPPAAGATGPARVSCSAGRTACPSIPAAGSWPAAGPGSRPTTPSSAPARTPTTDPELDRRRADRERLPDLPLQVAQIARRQLPGGEQCERRRVGRPLRGVEDPGPVPPL